MKRHKSLGTLLRPASKICSPTLRHTRRAHMLARPLITRLSQVVQLRLSPPSESSTHACLRRPLLRQNARIHATWPSESIVSCLFLQHERFTKCHDVVACTITPPRLPAARILSDIFMISFTCGSPHRRRPVADILSPLCSRFHLPSVASFTPTLCHRGTFAQLFPIPFTSSIHAQPLFPHHLAYRVTILYATLPTL